MQASKVTINSELLKSPKLTRAKKKLLREKLIKDLIESKPYGVPIEYKEFSRVCQYNSITEVGPLLKEMIKTGQITRENLKGTRSYSYSVCGQIHTTVINKKKTNTIKDLAKDFIWEKDTNDLREFIKWLEGKEYAGTDRE